MGRNGEKARAWEDTITIPTYELGPEDPNPPLLVGRRSIIHPGSRIVYPYPLQEELYNRCSDKTWRIFYLENRFLRIGVLPELGGRVLSVFDKAADQEALYRNHVIKYARIGIRGAFFAGGIEWNFPNGHTVTTSSPVDCATRSNEDGSASVVFGDIERVSRMRWTVAITLHPDSALFQAEIRLYNRTFLPNRYWFWANSAAAVSAGMQYRTTATRVSDLFNILSFPVDKGTDISWDRNHPEPQDMFSLNHREDFGAWYNHDVERGMVNCADRTESRGLKFFTWGTSDDGGIWEKRLTDSDGFYSEMQSGRFATQRTWGILPPCTEESWTESWYPITRIGPPDFANQEIALAAAPTERAGCLRLGVHATRAHTGARISLSRGTRTVWERTVDLSPSRPFIEETALQPGEGDLTVLVSDSAGRQLARYLRKSGNEAEVPITLPAHIEPGEKAERAEDLWLAGTEYEKLGEPDQARFRYEEALKVDPAFSPPQISLAVLELRQGLFDAAMQRLHRVLEENPADEGARFYLGACLLSCERFDEAAEHLKALMRSATYRPGASYLLGGISLGLGNPARALVQLEKCMSAYPWHQDAVSFSACALRKLNQAAEAEARVQRVISQDPLHLPSRAEAWFLAAASGNEAARDSRRKELHETLRRGAQSWLELSCEYARFGLYREAYELLSQCPEQDSMVHYHLGYYAEQLGSGVAASHYRRGGKPDPAYVFPHRLESERVLRRVLEVFPDDGRAWYYLGNLLCSRDRPEEAIACWEKALGSEDSFSVVRRNLGRACWKVRRDPDRAVSEYRRAIECAPGDYKLYLELDRILAACGRENERQKLLESIPAGLMENDLIAERVAAWRAEQEDFQGALDILARTYFYPWEIYKGVRFLYVDCCIGRGIQLEKSGEPEKAIASFRSAMTYPRNIGVGESRWKANAEAWYRIGLAQEKTGDTAAARASWTSSAEEPRPVVDALCYHRAMALRKLGRAQEAESTLDEMLAGAQQNLCRKIGAPAENHYLAGLALKGKGRRESALQSFSAALSANPTHRRSRWEQSGFAGE